MASLRIIARVVLPHRNGRYIPYGPGDVIPTSDLSEPLMSVLERSPEKFAGVLVEER